jgi:hypothetical protein
LQAEAELHCVVGNHRARRFYAIAFWRMRKILGGASMVAS